MAKSSVKHFYTTTSYQEALAALENATTTLDGKTRDAVSTYKAEVERTHEQFAKFEAEFLRDYEHYLGEYKASTHSIQDDFQSDYQANDESLAKQQKLLADKIAQENVLYRQVLLAFDELRSDAKATYDTICADTDRLIEKEIEIHREFVAASEAEFETLKANFAQLNNTHYDELLWAMEKSKNALTSLKTKLTEQSFQDAKLMNQTVLYLIEQLRDTKNKITHLFKTTTAKYGKRRDEIDRLAAERQIPHSVVNQKLIDQYVRQIELVNEKKTRFERLVKEDLESALAIIGPKIIENDKNNRRVPTERYILQYNIVRQKADYLLNQNTELSDLLITKYQNEIKKLKIDSFRRVEEIKLAYYLPSTFCQNSINLYSNFAFYVNEALDNIDVMLSDFIQGIQGYVDNKGAYLFESARVFEEYKINIHVMTNTITNKMTDLVLEIDRISKEIVLLESKNRLEIAEVQKAMEHADVTSDYQKYSARIDNDFELAAYQHDLNLKRIQSESDYQSQLLQVERTLKAIEEREQLALTGNNHQKRINLYERDIHDAHFDYELALAELQFRFGGAMLQQEIHEKATEIKRRFLHAAYQESQAYRLHESRYSRTKQLGSEYVIEYVHAIQKIITSYQTDTADAFLLLGSKTSLQPYLRHLYAKRQEAIQFLDYRHKQATASAEEAITFYHHQMYLLRYSIEADIDSTLSIWKHLLVRLNPDTSLLILDAFRRQHYNLNRVYGQIEFHSELALQKTRLYPDALFESSLASTKESGLLKILPLLSAFRDKAINLADHPKRLYSFAKATLVEAILAMEAYRDALLTLLDDYTKRLIENDVLFIHRAIPPYLDAKATVINYFDAELANAKALETTPKRLKRHVHASGLAFEGELKRRVFQLNEIYLAELKKETRLLNYIEKTTNHNIVVLEKQRDAELKRLAADHKHRTSDSEIRWLKFKKGFETMKVNNYEMTDKHNRYLDHQLGENYNQYAKERDALRVQVETAPKTLAQTHENDEALKRKLIEEREAKLLDEYARIEEFKYLSRPQYVKQIAEIKARMQADYTTKYQEIGMAENAFLAAQTQNTTDYRIEFERFLGAQSSYQAMLHNDPQLYRPFDDYFKSTDQLIQLTKEVFQGTYTKSVAAREQVKKRETAATEKQNRILDA
jgi:hypothetical protein